MKFPTASEVCPHQNKDIRFFICSYCQIEYSYESYILLYMQCLQPKYIIQTDGVHNVHGLLTVVRTFMGDFLFSLEYCKDYQDLLIKLNKLEIFK